MKPILTLLVFLPIFTISAQQVNLQVFANGFDQPIGLKTTGVPGDDRIFVVEKGGKVKILNPNGSVNPVPFLDISGQVSTGGERGLLGLVFHPNFASNGYLYVNYTDTNGDTQVSRFTVNGVNPNNVILSTELPIIDFSQPFSNHNGGDLAFGPNGYLFIATGDGGSGGDPGNRAQDLSVLLGKILRIDVDNPSGGNNYGIPPNNPFVSDPNALDEIWAYGLRNPWRFSFDTVGGNIWIGDVGQENVEEINRQSITAAGVNYGWRCYEGSQAYNTSGCPPVNQLTFPIAEYSSASGSGNCSVTGGFVYRGSVYTDILGLYFFADYCSGMIGTIDASGNVINHGNYNGNWVSFGKDSTGELYIIDIGGSIYKIEGGVMSTENFSNADAFSIFPNPASEKVSFQLKNGTFTAIKIYDLLGKIVFSKKNISSAEKTISIAGLENGIYLVEINTKEEGSAVKKLVVE
ncbi:MAG TPA: PQQ-dependent sugar dehydrogenase [Flavobacteriaceae bacterium]|nr:PQQ-dependent sugar dehydrogenase [Flavobacteriaceae bacterium]